MEPRLTDASRILGADQVAWLKRALAESTATWKVIASDMPIGLLVWDMAGDVRLIEAIANGDAGAPLGRELELAELLRFIKAAGIANTVWLTADVHYTAAHHYDPSRAAFQDFDPFWEFVSGPLHAGTFGPNALDPTFGPEVRFVKAPRPGRGQPAALGRAAVLRPRRHRRRHRPDDGPPDGPRRHRALERHPRPRPGGLSHRSSPCATRRNWLTREHRENTGGSDMSLEATKATAEKLLAHCRAAHRAEGLDELYDADAVSVEAVAMAGTDSARPAASRRSRASTTGGTAPWRCIRQQAEGPYLHGDDRFAVIFEFDATNRQTGDRMQMKEVAIYTVDDGGKIVREEFFYTT